MTKKPIKAEVEAKGDSTAPAEGGDAVPLDNVGRLSAHLNTDSLALKLLDAWRRAEPQKAKPILLKVVDDHFSDKK